MKILFVILLLLLAALQYKLWVDQDGVREVWRLSGEVAQHKREIAALRERNRQLAAEVIDLKSGLAAVEERARSDLGMIRQGETFYHLMGERPVSDGDVNGAGARRHE